MTYHFTTPATDWELVESSIYRSHRDVCTPKPRQRQTWVTPHPRALTPPSNPSPATREDSVMEHQTFRTRYTGPTDTVGSRITVATPHRRATVPYDYGARDAHATAVSEVTGIPVDALRQVRLTRTGRGFVYADDRSA